MKALIFSAGLGTRLKPLTDTMPKALVLVAGKPLLQHAILRLKDAGVDDIIVNIHHFPDQIIDFVHSNNNFGVKVSFSDERDMLLDTGGGIKKTASFFNDEKPFFAYNVDILSNLDLQAIYKAHLQSKSLATLFVSKRESSRYLLFDDSYLVGWLNTKTGETKPEGKIIDPSLFSCFAFNGIHVISPQIFPLMKDWPERFSIIDFYLSVSQQHNIQKFTFSQCQVLDVGKIDSLSIAENFLFNKSS